MGVVVKQSFWSTLISYTGVILGYINVLIIRPVYLNVSQIGLFQLTTSNGIMLMPASTLGMDGAYVRYYAEIKENEQLKSRFFTFQLVMVLLTNLMIVAIVLFNMDWIKNYFAQKSGLYNDYIMISLAIMVLFSFYNYLNSLCRCFLDIALPTFLREVHLRVFSTLLIVLYGFHYIGFDWAIKGLLVGYAILFLVLAFYLGIKYKVRPTATFYKLPKEWIRKMFEFGSYSLVLAISSTILLNISYLMVSSYLGLDANGIFTTCVYIGLMAEIPRRPILQLSSPIIANFFAQNDLDQISQFYRRGAVTLGTIGILLVIGIATNLDDLFLFIPKGETFRQGYWVVMCVALSKWLEMLFSFSGEIIIYSKHYKINLYIIVSGSILMIVLNAIMIPYIGIVGAALVYLFCRVYLVVFRYFVVCHKFKMSPFDRNVVLLLIISAIIWAVFHFIVFPFSPFFNIIIRSLAIAATFTLIIYKLKVSSDINTIVDTVFKKFLKPTFRS